MKPGDVVLVAFPQVKGRAQKLRPALVLSLLPGPYQTVLLCGISSRLLNIRVGWDERVQHGDPDWESSGLKMESVVRLSYLDAVHASEIVGRIGTLSVGRLERLLARLGQHLQGRG